MALMSVSLEHLEFPINLERPVEKKGRREGTTSRGELLAALNFSVSKLVLSL